MRTELPVCKRCCFCLPLRYGLITWGYIRLIAASLLSISLIITLVNTVEMMIAFGKQPGFIYQVVVLCVILLTLLIEVVLNTLFVVGGHMKNLKLLRVYYIYIIVLWALSIAGALVLLGFTVLSLLAYHDIYPHHAWLLLLDFSVFFFDIVAQSYVLLLLRSEIIKLRNNCEFRFVNNAAEAECTMKYTEGIVDEEKETEDVSENGTCEIKDSCKKLCQCKGMCRRNDDGN